MSNRSIVLIAVAAALAVPIPATAQQPHAAALGDLMTAFVQPRHIKLGLAGTERNWPYAAYESISCVKPSPTSPRSCRNIGICRSRT